MFILSEFVMRCIRGMARSEPEYKVREYALGWFDRGVLTEENLSEVNTLLEAKTEEVPAAAEETEATEPEESNT